MTAVFDGPALDERLAAGVPPLTAFRELLQTGRETFRQRFFDKPSATPRLVGDSAAFIDALLKRAWELHRPALPGKTSVALVAVGGYGRGELHPASDIDLLLLFGRFDASAAQGFVETFVRFLWDIGLEIGHSVRTVRECVSEAKGDLTVATTLMETRLLAGDEALWKSMLAKTGPNKIWSSGKFFAGKLAEQRERHRRFDDTAYNLEPNLKDGPGGLRDLQTLAWVTQRHFGTAALHELVTHGFLREDEYRSLIRGRHYLWMVRAGLHHLAGRREERLLFDHQRELAELLGYRDRTGALAVEQFMKRYYRTVKSLQLLNVILLQHFDEEILTKGKPKVQAINRRFHSRGGYLEVTNARVFERTPFAMLELFLILQQRPALKGVRANTIRLLRANLKKLDSKARRDLACRSLFMEILRQPHGITHELRRMNAWGVLGQYLPAFGRIVGQMQHDLFHVYTVDQHTLFVVRNLRRFTVPEFRAEFPLASSLIERLVKPERLLIAGLFHDIAKGRGGDHSALGADDAVAFGHDHHLSEYDTRFIAWLVQHHLVMSTTAQRRDIADPDVVHEFARQVGDLERLENLYLLTVADMRATSPAVWNTWKDRLLQQLYHSTARVLERGLAEPVDREARAADLRRDALVLLREAKVALPPVEEFWRHLDAGYFLQHDAPALAWHARTIAAGDLPAVSSRFQPEMGGSELLVYTPDRDDLFAVLTGGIDRLGLSIVEARIHTLANGNALDTFVVLDHNGTPISDARELQRLQGELHAQLLHPRPGRDWRDSPLPRTLRHFPIQSRVIFTDAPDKPHTVVEVTTQDRPGLLYQIALALRACGLNLVNAKVATYGERVEDIFFVSTREGGPVNNPEQRACLEREILSRLSTGDAPASSA
ncbi:MAG: [protein-PII] uridylyltransferase [Pseudomonadota bacterium]